MNRLRIIIALLFALLVVPAQADPSFPKLTGRVIDAAKLLDPQQTAAIETRLAALEQQSGHQLVVATIPDLQGYDIGDYGYQLGRAWGLGSKETNDGAILIIAPQERRVRVEVGYGLEPVLTDAFSSQVIQTVILPRFKANDYPGGIAAGTDAIAQQIALPPEEAAKRAQAASQAAQQAHSRNKGGNLLPGLVFFMFILLFVVVPMFGARGGRRYDSGGIGNIILWSVINSAMNSRGGGGSSWSSGGGSDWGGGGGGGDGGGFSGGGGSFGGGGASGGW